MTGVTAWSSHARAFHTGTLTGYGSGLLMAGSELQDLGEQVRELISKCEDFIERAEDLRQDRHRAEGELYNALRLLKSDWHENVDECIERWGHWEYDTQLENCPSLLESGGRNIEESQENSQSAITAAKEWLALHLGD